MAWWIVKNNINDRQIRIPPDGGEAQLYISSKDDPYWEPCNVHISLDEILEMFLYPELQLTLE